MLDVSEDGRTLVTTFAIENVPSGSKRRETYRNASDYEFVETLDLAEPSKEFARTRRHGSAAGG